ncbi:SBBP repeat-containing protein [Sorangium sp. So ce124]|uniref:SBBP repeat-containing protein n=1 Tax=Sorangium sp. So ce124 TaxID=3133280 RepID=UPI003F6438CF
MATPGTATADAVCADPYFKFGSEGLYVAFAVAVDGGGNVYVAGNTYGAFGSDGGESDVFVRKLDAHGSVVWTQRFGTSSDDHAKGVAVDGSGNVYVAGTTGGALEGANGGFGDAFVRKLDASGATLWTRQLATWRSESANALAVDGQGNAYVAGTSYGGPQETGEAFVTKIDTNGAPAWTQLFGGPDEDEAMAVAVDGSGNTYVGGYTSGGVVADSDRGQRDAFVRKLDSSGTTSWTRQFGSTENDFVFAARVDGNGDLYVAGSTAGEVGGPSEGSPEAFVRKFDAGGATSWTHHAGNASYDYSFALAIDGNDDVYLVGSTSGGEEDVYVRKLDASGAALWTKEIGTPRSDTALAAASGADGNLYVAGYTGEFFNTSDAFVLHVPTE